MRAGFTQTLTNPLTGSTQLSWIKPGDEHGDAGPG